MGRASVPVPEEAAVRDAQQGDRDGRAPLSQEPSNRDLRCHELVERGREVMLAGMEARACDGAFWFAMLLRLGRLPIAALRLKSDGASASCTAGEAAARDAQQGDRDGRAPPFSRAVNRNF